MEFLLFFLIGAAIGGLAGILWKNQGFSPLGYVLVGIVGGMVGGGVFRSMGPFVSGGLGVHSILAIIGAAFFVAILRIFKRP